MRVALVGDYPLTPNQIHIGPEAVFKYLLDGLKSIDELELSVVTANKNLTQMKNFRQDNVEFHFLPQPRLPMELAFPILLSRIRRTLDRIKPDLIHPQSGYIYGAICVSANYPSVATVHNVPGTEPRFANRRLNRWRLKLHDSLTARYFYARIRHIICISPYIQRGLRPRTQANFYCVDNPIAEDYFQLPIDQAVSDRLLLIANFRRIKHPELAIEAVALAVKQIPTLTLHLAGSIDDRSVYEQVLKLIDQFNLQSHVQVLGYINEDRIKEEYQQASIVLLTSELEVSPMVIEQAMAAGKPVIATAVGGVPDLIRDGRTGILVERGNANELAEAIICLARDQNLRRKIGEAARVEAFDRFHTKTVGQKIHQVYRYILREESIVVPIAIKLSQS